MVGTDQNDSTSDKKRIIIPAAIGVGMLLLGLVLGIGIASMTGAGKMPETTPVVITQIVQAPTQPPLPTYTPLNTPESQVVIITPTIFNSPTPESTVNPVFQGVEGAECLPAGGEEVLAQVAQVVSGSEILVTIDGQTRTIRLLGVQAPDPSNFFASWSRSKNFELTSGKELTLVKDVYASDPEGYLPRFVIADGKFVNYEILREGYGRMDRQGSVTSCDDLFQTVADAAQVAGLGLWQYEPTPTPKPTEAEEAQVEEAVTIVDIVRLVTAGGTSDQEYVEIRNDGTQPVQLQFWRMLDTQANIYSFPQFEMQPGQTCRVYTNADHPETCGFNWGIPDTVIWGPESDCASLSNALGAIVEQKCY